ncbi:MAG: hypothetical protein FJX62_10300 [Alphaproteobacteria bacterium]|nr:hypothetical protein [Alphaproteobacteria bacterium]
MKRILLVVVDLSRSVGDTKALFEAIKEQGRWWHYMKPMWLIYTDKTPNEVVEALKPHIQGRGRLMVTYLNRPYQGLLPKDAWEWIRKRVDAE